MLVNVNDGAIDRIAADAVRAIAVDVLATAVATVPMDLGTLGRSLVAKPEADGSWTVGTNVVYAPFVEFGTRPHVIRPDTKKALKFTTKGGTTVFAKVVHHPGTRAQPFLGPALEQVRRRWGL